MNCPCGGETFEACCGPYIKGVKSAETAESLMRSRYTAYTIGDVDYIKKTTVPAEQEEFDLDAAKKWAEESEWLGFELLSQTGGTSTDSEAKIEFTASYKIKGKKENHHEISTFKQIDGTWYFADGQIITQVVNEQPKVGRNEPCVCGSGKKYKKCCG